MKHLSIDITNYVIHIKGRKEETQQIAFVLNVSRKTVTEVLPLVFKVDVLWKIGLNFDIFIYKGNSVTYYACSNQQKYAHLKKSNQSNENRPCKVFNRSRKAPLECERCKNRVIFAEECQLFLKFGTRDCAPALPVQEFQLI